MSRRGVVTCVRSRCGRVGMSFIEKTEVYKRISVCAAQTGCWTLSLFACVRARARTEINPKAMTGRDRPRSKAYHLDSPLDSRAHLITEGQWPLRHVALICVRVADSCGASNQHRASVHEPAIWTSDDKHLQRALRLATLLFTCLQSPSFTVDELRCGRLLENCCLSSSGMY